MEGEVINKNEYSLFLKIEELDIDVFLHCNDLSYVSNPNEELDKYKKGDKLKVKVLEIKPLNKRYVLVYVKHNQILLIGLKIKRLIKLSQLK